MPPNGRQPPGRALAALRWGLSSLWCGLVSGCLAWPDPTSASWGNPNAGGIVRPRVLPSEGPGWSIPSHWRERGLHFGTDELVGAVTHAAARVNDRLPTSTLGIADLSRTSGGWSRWHRSHHSGRDVDVHFYSVNAQGRSLPPPAAAMVRYGADGRSIPADHPSEADVHRQFDVARNWMLVESLLRDPSIRVQWIFVAEHLRQRLLEHARAQARPAWARAYAEVVMRQPNDSAPHDDHFHIRVYCSRSDRHLGCLDTGPVWQHEKKTQKYTGPERYDPVLWRRLKLRAQ